MKQDWISGHIGDFYLERYLLGELKDSQLKAMEERLASDAELRTRLQALRDNENIFSTRFPAHKIVAEIKLAAFPKPKLFQRIFDALPIRELTFGRRLQWAGVFALLVLAIVPMVRVYSPVETEVIRIKGKQVELRLFRNTPVGPERLVSGDSARSGDIIQAEFHPGGFAFGAIYSVDGNGNVTLHWPSRPDASNAWATLKEYRLPVAFELDQAPRFERFHLLVSKHPLVLENLAAKVARSAQQDDNWLATQLPKSVKVTTLVLKKAALP